MSRAVLTSAKVSAFLALAVATALAAGTAGDLDGNFGGGDGIVSVAGAAAARDLVTQAVADGEGTRQRYVLGGQALAGGTGWPILAYTESGDPDASFGSGGLVTLFTGDANATFVQELALDAQGRVLALGRTTVTTTVAGKGGKTSTTTRQQVTVVRLTPAGTPDAQFGQGGVVRLWAGSVSGTEFPMGVSALPDGGVLVCGTTFYYEGSGKNRGENRRMFFARLTAQGTLDSGFGSQGIAYDPRSSESVPGALGVQSDGRFVVAHKMDLVSGAWQETWVVSRYAAGGSLDTTFATGGRAVTNAAPSVQRLVVDPTSDRIAVAGFRSGSVAQDRALVFARYTANGQLDSAFGAAGISVVQPPSSTGSTTYGLQVDDSGRLVFPVAVFDGNAWTVTVGRLGTDGAPDAAFGTNGFGERIAGDAGYQVGLATAGYVLVSGGTDGPCVSRLLK